MRSKLEIEVNNDTIQKLAVKATGDNMSIGEYIECILLDHVTPVDTDTGQQPEMNLAENSPVGEVHPAVEKLPVASVFDPKPVEKDLTRPPFNKHGEKPVPLKQEVSNSWVNPNHKKTTNSWLF